MALMTYARGRRAWRCSDAMAGRRERRRPRRGRRPRRHLPAVQGAAAGIRRAARRSTRRSRRRRSSAPASAWRSRGSSRWSRCAWSTSRCARWTRSSTRRPRRATCSAARDACRWWRACRSACGAARPRSTRRASRPGSRTCPGLVVVTPATPQDNYSLLRAAIDCGDPVIYMEHKELWGLQGEWMFLPAESWAKRGWCGRQGPDAGHLVANRARRARGSGKGKDFGRGHRPAHPLAVGPRDGVFFREENRKAAGGARSGAGGWIRRRDRRHGGGGAGSAGEAPRRAADSGRLFEAARGRGARHCRANLAAYSK